MNTQEINSSEFERNAFNNFMELYFNPEIAKRKEHHQLPNDFQLIAAHAILFPDGRPPIIRLNDEVIIEVKLKHSIGDNTQKFSPSISINDLEYMKPCEEKFLNCGYIILLQFKDSYQMFFDFRYNKETSSKHLIAALQFLKTSKYALDNDFIFAFIDNSFSAVELLAKTNLLIEANANTREKTSHKTIKTAFNQRHKYSKMPFEIKRRQVFNQLSDARANARYLEGDIKFNGSELEEIYQTIERMYSELSQRVI